VAGLAQCRCSVSKRCGVNLAGGDSEQSPFLQLWRPGDDVPRRRQDAEGRRSITFERCDVIRAQVDQHVSARMHPVRTGLLIDEGNDVRLVDRNVVAPDSSCASGFRALVQIGGGRRTFLRREFRDDGCFEVLEI